jgi:hypothetical protein
MFCKVTSVNLYKNLLYVCLHSAGSVLMSGREQKDVFSIGNDFVYCLSLGWKLAC